MSLTRIAIGAALALLAGAGSAGGQAAPLAPLRETGQTVTPAFEGWYRNPDGSFSLSFGYYNRNTREVLEIPIGPHNVVEPGGPNRGQPTHFLPRRHWGVFAVTVPADFTGRVVWKLIVRRDTFAIPGSLKPGWEIDALQGEAGSGNTPPVLRFAGDKMGRGPEARGPGGIAVGPLVARVGQPLPLVVWASDDGKAVGSIASDGRANVPVTLTWFKHQGTGEVRFANSTPPVGREDGKAVTEATFSHPGEYVLRVRANDASGVANAGHAQCCWTNGFVKVRVTP